MEKELEQIQQSLQEISDLIKAWKMRQAKEDNQILRDASEYIITPAGMDDWHNSNAYTLNNNVIVNKHMNDIDDGQAEQSLVYIKETPMEVMATMRQRYKLENQLRSAINIAGAVPMLYIGDNNQTLYWIGYAPEARAFRVLDTDTSISSYVPINGILSTSKDVMDTWLRININELHQVYGGQLD